jgi:hypothetical protein
VHCSILWDLRLMPEMYQGLGIFDLNVDRLGIKVYFVKRHLGTPYMMGSMFSQAFEVFQIKVGLQGNIFTWNFSMMSALLDRH